VSLPKIIKTQIEKLTKTKGENIDKKGYKEIEGGNIHRLVQ